MNSYNKTKIHSVDSRANTEEIKMQLFKKMISGSSFNVSGEENQEVNEITQLEWASIFYHHISD